MPPREGPAWAARHQPPGATPARPSAAWRQQAEITASDGATNDNCGYSIAVSGTTALVGAYNKNGGTGAAYVFMRRGTSWSQQAELTDPCPCAGGDNFGAVALSGNTALIGAHGKTAPPGRRTCSWDADTLLSPR